LSVPEEDFHTRLDVVGDNLVIYPIPDRDPLVIDLDRPRPKPIRSPGQALEAHLKMYNWLLSPHGEDHVARLYRAYTDPERNPRKSYNEEERMAVRATQISLFAHNSTTYVSSDMLHIVDNLSKTEFGADFFHLTDVPDNGGVILFEHTLQDDLFEVGDPMREMMQIAGFAYAFMGRDGTYVTDYKKIVAEYKLVDDSPEKVETVTKQTKEHGALVVVPLYDAGMYLVEEGAWLNRGRPQVLPMALMAVPFGPMLHYTEGTNAERVRRILLSLFRLMWQRILPRDPWIPKRHERRQFDRLRKHPLEGEQYKVIHVRRYEGRQRFDDRHPMESDGLRWSRPAVIVRGHPKMQWYSSLGPAYNEDGSWNLESHRKIWVDAYIRGDGEPVWKHNVTAVIR